MCIHVFLLLLILRHPSEVLLPLCLRCEVKSFPDETFLANLLEGQVSRDGVGRYSKILSGWSGWTSENVQKS